MQELIQRRLSQQVADIGHLSYEAGLKKLGLFSIYGRLLWADIIKCRKIFHGEVVVWLQVFFVSVDRQI